MSVFAVVVLLVIVLAILISVVALGATLLVLATLIGAAVRCMKMTLRYVRPLGNEHVAQIYMGLAVICGPLAVWLARQEYLQHQAGLDVEKAADGTPDVVEAEVVS